MCIPSECVQTKVASFKKKWSIMVDDMKTEINAKIYI